MIQNIVYSNLDMHDSAVFAKDSGITLITKVSMLNGSMYVSELLIVWTKHYPSLIRVKVSVSS